MRYLEQFRLLKRLTSQGTDEAIRRTPSGREKKKASPPNKKSPDSQLRNSANKKKTMKQSKWLTKIKTLWIRWVLRESKAEKRL